MNWYKKAQLEIPPTLYHATFKSNLESIKQRGLDPNLEGIVKCWTDCEKGIYLHIDPEVAMSYVEVSENTDIPEEWFDSIIVLEINTLYLDKVLLVTDPNIAPPNNVDSFLYKGIIPFDAIGNIL